MIDFYHKLYNKTYVLENTFLSTIKVDAILRLVILYIANITIPIYFKFNSSYKSVKQAEFVVSLTSFPNRISKVHLVVESILRQTFKPKRIILWLSEEQFSSLNMLPRKLLKLRKKGLEIYLRPGDIRSYKKYYYFLKENPNEAFIIIDDDIFYPSKTIENLVKTNKKYPNAVCANRCSEIIENKPYAKWIGIKGEALTPRFNLLPTGCGGVLYPANSLYRDVVNKKLFTELCFDADDIWLNSMTFLNKTPIAFTGKNEYLLAVKKINNKHLYKKNIGKSNNDFRIKLVKEYYKKVLGINVFDRS
ncbi:hypothetical protein MHL31_00960 [Lutibacter sp. A80]|uniref:hypothetical protein n=1 Tax=Lutibacter sp. A80 TaxID=2918453 RepID=UPI001F052642|nr:hypothetical protein [Lutibacter sp. A80]UMB60797.1 hypothetical protein MHL31_00960 [Lutibacter sp. A80]